MAAFIVIEEARPGCTMCGGVAKFKVMFETNGQYPQIEHIGWACDDHRFVGDVLDTCFCGGGHIGSQQKNGHRTACPRHPNAPTEVRRVTT